MKDLFGSIGAALLFITGSATPEIMSNHDPITWILQNTAFVATITVAVVTILRKRKKPVK